MSIVVLRGPPLLLLFLAACPCASPAADASGSSTGAGATSGSGGVATSGSSGSTSGSTPGSTSGSTGASECAVRGELAPCDLDGLRGTCCRGACVDVSHDPTSCGQCGEGCFVGWSCEFGACTPPAGADGGVCPAGTSWSSGYQSCLPTSCPRDATSGLCTDGDGGDGFCCNGACGSDCAGCGFGCGAGASCELGYACGPGVSCGLQSVCASACPPGTLSTDSSPGIGSFCTPTDCSSPAEAEGLPCAFDAGAAVGSGICCGGACVDEGTDPHNCGVCGNACPAGSFCDLTYGRGCPLTSCAGAAAEAPCVLDAGVVGACCGGACVDENGNPAACGGCGIACIPGESCLGICRGPDAGTVGCDVDPGACPAGTRCSGNRCLALGCGADGQLCAFGAVPGECCGGRCTDPLHDPANCGACGFGSPGGVCLEGNAFPIPYDAGTGDHPCIGGFGWGHDGPYCDDPGCACIQGLPAGLPCITLPLCVLGDGGPALCCDVGPGGGSCLDVLDDPRNCGACGVVCPSGQACSNGVCSGTAAACGPGHTGGFCNLDAGPGYLCCPGGGCTNTLADPANCGACGVVCDGGCVAGSCA
ncbi:MAG: hypothetical protein ACYDCL_10180 [Myxococcales bacterium]